MRQAYPKIIVYSQKYNPANMLKFDEINKSNGFVTEEEAKCDKLKEFFLLLRMHIKQIGKIFFLFICIETWIFLIIFLFKKVSLNDTNSNNYLVKSSLTLNDKTNTSDDDELDKPADVVQMRIFFLRPDGTAANQNDIRNFHVEIRNNYENKLDAFSVKNEKYPENIKLVSVGEERVWWLPRVT